MPKMAYIYALRENGSDEVRYVGQTVSPKSRLNAHQEDTPKSSDDLNPKRCWVKSVNDSGGQVEMIILDKCDIADAVRVEQQWIDYYREQSTLLTNTAPAIRSSCTPEFDVYEYARVNFPDRQPTFRDEDFPDDWLDRMERKLNLVLDHLVKADGDANVTYLEVQP